MKVKKVLIFVALLLGGVLFTLQAQKKVGIIGLDTSHSIAFTKMLNAEEKKPEHEGFKVVAAYPHGSRTIESSYKRIPGYIKEIEEYGVEVVNSIEELLSMVDCVMLETNDGNMHLEQAEKVFKAGKIVFIDKPIGADLAQAIAIFELAEKYNIPVFSSSTLRYSKQNVKLRNGEFGDVFGADCYSPSPSEPSHPDFSFYGIHGVETLFTIMGTGCKSVNRMSSNATDVVVGLWDDGRIGTFRAIVEGRRGYGGTAFTEKGFQPVGPAEGYDDLLVSILEFFKTGVPPVSSKETLEIFTFMEASNISKRYAGKIISMETTFKEAQKDAQKLIEKL